MITNELMTLASYLAGEFDNREQALAQPVWYVHLRLWQRPVPLFTEDSLTLFAEQASIVNLEQPYRPRLLRLRQSDTQPNSLQVQYYMFKDIKAIGGASRHPDKLATITTEQIEFLPSCTLNVAIETLDERKYRFVTTPASQTPCRFTYQNQTYQVSLGFAATTEELQVFDKGIEPQTGKAIWGALLGPFCFTKRRDFSPEFPINPR